MKPKTRLAVGLILWIFPAWVAGYFAQGITGWLSPAAWAVIFYAGLVWISIDSVKFMSRCPSCGADYAMEESGISESRHEQQWREVVEHHNGVRRQFNAPFDVHHYTQHERCKHCGYSSSRPVSESTRAR